MNQPQRTYALLRTRRMVQPVARQFYEETLRILARARVPYLVGGALALKHFAGVARDTKDLDIFLRRRDLARALEVLEGHGYQTDLLYPHWLGKAWSGPFFVDLIFDSANGLYAVDDAWFEHAAQCMLWRVPVLVCPVEELIAVKSFVMERERFDGADVYHLIEACGPTLDWDRLLARFGEHWRVLLGHLVFFSFVYPQRRQQVPARVMQALLERAKAEHDSEEVEVCRGTLLSREQYLVDLRERGYADARTPPWGGVTRGHIQRWTNGIVTGK